MSFNPIGYRRVWDMIVEISLHLLEPIVVTSLTQNVSPGTSTVTVANTYNVVVGTQVIVDSGNAREAITVTAIPTATSITATFLNSHNTGAAILGATFPLQVSTDPLFTQSEITGYIARAQNQFLFDCPYSYQLLTQNTLLGQIFQPSPVNMIEMERIAYSSLAIPVTSLVRLSNVVTASTSSSHGLSVNQPFSVFGTNAAFNGAFVVATVPSPSSLTYNQGGSNATFAGGTIGLWSRLYETSQEAIASLDPNWAANSVSKLTTWFEDRSGLYQWGLGSNPAVGFPLETLSSMRDNDVLTQLEGFLVPDILMHFVKYKALEYAWSKDGECRNPLLSQYCSMRYQRGVMAVNRWMGAMGAGIGMTAAAGLSALAGSGRGGRR